MPASTDDVVSASQNRNQLMSLLILAVQALAPSVSTGSFTMAAAATKVVSDANVQSTSLIFLSPTNAAAGTLQGSTKCLYISSISAGVSFTVATASAVAAAGTETFGYLIR